MHIICAPFLDSHSSCRFPKIFIETMMIINSILLPCWKRNVPSFFNSWMMQRKCEPCKFSSRIIKINAVIYISKTFQALQVFKVIIHNWLNCNATFDVLRNSAWTYKGILLHRHLHEMLIWHMFDSLTLVVRLVLKCSSLIVVQKLGCLKPFFNAYLCFRNEISLWISLIISGRQSNY